MVEGATDITIRDALFDYLAFSIAKSLNWKLDNWVLEPGPWHYISYSELIEWLDENSIS